MAVLMLGHERGVPHDSKQYLGLWGSRVDESELIFKELHIGPPSAGIQVSGRVTTSHVSVVSATCHVNSHISDPQCHLSGQQTTISAVLSAKRHVGAITSALMSPALSVMAHGSGYGSDM